MKKNIKNKQFILEELQSTTFKLNHEEEKTLRVSHLMEG